MKFFGLIGSDPAILNFLETLSNEAEYSVLNFGVYHIVEKGNDYIPLAFNGTCLLAYRGASLIIPGSQHRFGIVCELEHREQVGDIFGRYSMSFSPTHSEYLKIYMMKNRVMVSYLNRKMM